MIDLGKRMTETDELEWLLRHRRDLCPEAVPLMIRALRPAKLRSPKTKLVTRTGDKRADKKPAFRPFSTKKLVTRAVL